MSAFIQDLRFAVRLLLKQPGFTLAVTATLALAIGVNSAMFSLVNRAVFAPLPFPESDRLVRVFRQTPDGGAEPFSYPDYLEYRERNTAFEELIAFSFIPVGLETPEGSQSRFGQLVSGNYFNALRTRALHGRLLTPEDDRTPGAHPVVVLSHRHWQRFFGGDPAAVGKLITISGHPYTIVGIAPPGFSGALPIPSPDFWAPMNMIGVLRAEEAGRLEQRGTAFLMAMGRLLPEVSLEQAAARMTVTASQLVEMDAERYGDEGIMLVPSNGIIPLTPELRRVALAVSALIMSMVGLVLIVGCANVANLLLARSITRGREIGIRLAIGAPRWRIVRQLLTESMVLALFGGAAGLVLSVWAMDALVAALPALPFNISLGMDFGIDLRVLAFTAVVSLVTGLLFGLFPALGATKVDLASAMKDDRGAGWPGVRRSRMRSALVVAQVAASLVLLIVAGLFLRSLIRARGIDPGFDHEEVLTVMCDIGARTGDRAEGARFCARLLERARTLPGVESASIHDPLPLTGAVTVDAFWIEGRPYADPEDEKTSVFTSSVSSDSFRTLGIPLLRGRDFGEQDGEGAPGVAVVNKAFVDRFWPGEEPLGRRVSSEGAEGPFLEVVGVVPTVKFLLVGEEPRPHIYRAQPQNPSLSIVALCLRTPGDPLALAAPVRALIREIDPNMTLANTERLTGLISFVLLPARLAAAAFGLFGLLALVLAAVGLYGVMSYSVSQRTREIGIRITLGARRGQIIGLVLRQGIRLTAIGLAIGLAISLAGTRLLGSLLYDIGTADAVTFIAVSLILAAVALLASWIPALRTTRVNPVEALRAE